MPLRPAAPQHLPHRPHPARAAAARALAALGAALALWGLAQPAHADLWAFVDERGITHFAAQALDERYKLYFRGSLYDSTEQGLKPPLVEAEAAADDDGGSDAGRRLQASTRMQSFFDISPRYKSVRGHLRKAADHTGVDYDLLKAVIAVESGFDAQAISPKGAVGLMQLMPATAERYGVTADKSRSIEDKLTDPRTNIRAGARYLSYLIKLFPGRIDLAVAAYNAGEGAVKRSSNQIPNYKETRDYVATVLGLYAAFKGDASVPVAKAFKSNKLPKAGTAVAAEAGSAQPVSRTRQGGRVRIEFPAAADASSLSGTREALARP